MTSRSQTRIAALGLDGLLLGLSLLFLVVLFAALPTLAWMLP